MEDYDDLANGPNDDGHLDLSHNTWKTLPPEINNFCQTLQSLALANNQLSSIPQSIGNLVLLRSLDVSYNQIDTIDPAIGKCIRLQSLNVSNNRVNKLPAELGSCTMLEQILANDNKLHSLPNEILNLFAISVLDVRNNQLESIPLELCRIPTLRRLLCDGNPKLRCAPENMRGDSNLLISCLEMQLNFEEVIIPKEAELCELQATSVKLQFKLTQAKSRIEQLEKAIAELEWERPDRYIYWKGRLNDFVHHVREKITMWCEITKQSFYRWHERRRTYPRY